MEDKRVQGRIKNSFTTEPTEPEFYGDLVYKLKKRPERKKERKIVDRASLSDQRRIKTRKKERKRGKL